MLIRKRKKERKIQTSIAFDFFFFFFIRGTSSKSFFLSKNHERSQEISSALQKTQATSTSNQVIDYFKEIRVYSDSSKFRRSFLPENFEIRTVSCKKSQDLSTPEISSAKQKFRNSNRSFRIIRSTSPQPNEGEKSFDFRRKFTDLQVRSPKGQKAAEKLKFPPFLNLRAESQMLQR